MSLPPSLLAKDSKIIQNLLYFVITVPYNKI